MALSCASKQTLAQLAHCAGGTSGSRSNESRPAGGAVAGLRQCTGGQNGSFAAGYGACLRLAAPQVGERLGSAGRKGVLVEATAVKPASEVGAPVDMEWDDIGFGLRHTDFMFMMTCERGQEWRAGELRPFGNIELSPSAAVLNYGQGAFEGMKAYRTAEGRILLFRPEENALRMIQSADRLSMPAPPVEAFVAAVKQTVAANKRWVPPPGKGSMYIRPLLIGSGPILGLAPAPEYTFLIYVSPVGNYFKTGQLTPLQLQVEEKYHRAAPGGTGAAKVIGNYSPVLKIQLAAKGQGFSDVVYLDAVENKFIEEVSSCNIFIIKDKKISTPELRGTILPGITRKSIIALARRLGYEVAERPVSIDELLDADEVFCTGTAVVVSPVGKVTFRSKETTYGGGETGAISQQLYTALTELQMGKAPDPLGWTVEVL